MAARQLHLFKGKRQRGELPPRPKEFSLHVQLAKTLERWRKPDWRYTHIASGEKRDKATAGRLKAMGVTRGWPDFIVVGRDGEIGRVIFIELKREGEKRSEEQHDIAMHLIWVGCSYICDSDYQRVVEALVDLGVLRSMRVSA